MSRSTLKPVISVKVWVAPPDFPDNCKRTREQTIEMERRLATEARARQKPLWEAAYPLGTHSAFGSLWGRLSRYWMKPRGVWREVKPGDE